MSDTDRQDQSEVNALRTELSDDNVDNKLEKKKKTPRRVLHFSDGTLEEYSTDDDGDEIDTKITKTTVSELDAVDPKSLTWKPWLKYHTLSAGSKTLKACDYAGEKLASLFGITSPKYEYEIDFYKTLKAEEEEQKRQQDLEMGGWVSSDDEKKKQTTVNEIPQKDAI